MLTKTNLLPLLLLNFILFSLPDHVLANENHASQITISSFIKNNDSTKEQTTVINLSGDESSDYLDTIFDLLAINIDDFKNNINKSIELSDSLFSIHDNHISLNRSNRKVALGVIIEEFNQINNERYKNPLISKILPNSPADKAGLQEGDLVYLVDQNEVNSLEEIVEIIKTKSEGDSLYVSYIRANDTLSTIAILKSAPQHKSWATLLQQEVGLSDSCAIKNYPFCKKIMIQKGGPKLGVKVKDLNAEARKALRARKGGAMITKVIENTTAEEMQLQINDVIIEVNGHEIQNVNELKEIIDSYPEQKSVHLKYIRYGKKKKTSGVLKEFSLEWEEADMMKIIDLSGLSKE